MSAWVAAMQSASAEMGTHTSVVSAPLPGRIARVASMAPWRACHRRRRSASSEAQAKSDPPHSAASSAVSRAWVSTSAAEPP